MRHDPSLQIGRIFHAYCVGFLHKCLARHDDMTDMTLTRYGLVSVLNIIMCVSIWFLDTDPPSILSTSTGRLA
jgi:hypothetical protein